MFPVYVKNINIIFDRRLAQVACASRILFLINWYRVVRCLLNCKLEGTQKESGVMSLATVP